jgi:hypothetical protein
MKTSIKTLSIKVFCFLMALALSSCKRKGNNVDPFYNNRGEWDDVELPLIKPYKLVKLNGNKEWVMNLEEWTFSISLGDVKEINVVNDLILVHSYKTALITDTISKEVWVVIVPKKKQEIGFLKYREYLAYLNKIGLKNELKLHNVEDVAKYAGKNQVIKWNEINSYN